MDFIWILQIGRKMPTCLQGTAYLTYESNFAFKPNEFHVLSHLHLSTLNKFDGLATSDRKDFDQLEDVESK